jgi:NTE family protein
VKRGLVLNAGLAWAAYQVGALRHLVGERGLHFDLCAGTGIGAMHAALIACDDLPALEAFWQGIGPRRLLAPNWRTPWREGPCVGTPQREFIARHVSEERLAARRVRLLVSTANLQTGREEVLAYPGHSLPIVDGLMAAVATPGLCPPVRSRGQQLVEGTTISSFLLRAVVAEPVDEVFAVAVAMRPGPASSRRYPSWRAVAARAFAMNQAWDVTEAVAHAGRVRAAAAAFRAVAGQVPALADRIPDAAAGARLRTRLESIYTGSAFPLRRDVPLRLHTVTPSRALDYPFWRFRAGDVHAAIALGYDDARAVCAKDGVA